MTAASRLHDSGIVVAVAVATGLLAGCTGEADEPATTPTSARTSSAPPATAAPAPSRTPVSRPPLPSFSAPSSLPDSPPVQLAPVSASPDDLGRVDIRQGSTQRRSVAVRLPAASGYTVTAGCIGRPGTLLRYSVAGTSEPNAGFLFGSTTPCNGRFVTDAALANIDAATPARLEVLLDAGVRDATVVLRPAPTDDHLGPGM